MHESRNFKNSFKNLYTGLFYGGLFKFLNGMEPFNLRNKQRDCDALKAHQHFQVIDIFI